MLSHELAGLQAKFADYAHDGMELTPEACTALARVFGALVDQARLMEITVVPDHLRVATVALPALYGENVVPIGAAPRRRQTRPVPPAGGHAA